MLRIYKRLWQVNWAEQWQYRANLMMYLLYGLVSPVVYLAVWVTIANSQGSVNGLTANDFITYYLTLLVVDQLTGDITIHILAYKIQDGTLSNELLRPIHPILTQTLVYNLAFKVLTSFALIPVWLILLALFQPNFSAVSWGSILLAIPAVILGFVTNFLLGAIITSVAFWTTRVYAISEFTYALVVLFSGQFVPLQLMPAFIQTLARFLPFQMFRYVPIEILLDRLAPEEILRDFGVGLAWLIFFLFVFEIVWREGVKRFTAVGT